MSQKIPFGPYATPEEADSGKRKMLVSLVLALAATVLAVVAVREVGDDRLVTAYAGAGIIWFLVAMAEAVRWSNTGEFERVE